MNSFSLICLSNNSLNNSKNRLNSRKRDKYVIMANDSDVDKSAKRKQLQEDFNIC